MKRVWPLWVGIVVLMMAFGIFARVRGRSVSVAVVAESLAHPDAMTRKSTAQQLANVPAPRSVPAVIARLSVESEAPIRILLLKALIQAGTYEGAKGVLVGLRDANPDVRAEARKILSAWYEQPMPDAMPAAEIEALVNSRPPKLLRVQ